MSVNEKIGGSKENMYEVYKNIIREYYKKYEEIEVPETDEEEDKKYRNAVDKGYEIYSQKGERRKKKHTKDKWVMLVKGILGERTRGGKLRKHKKIRTKKKSRKAKKKTRRSRT